jgi:hypothetical protein
VHALADLGSRRRTLGAIHAVALAAVCVTLLARAPGSVEVRGMALAAVAVAFGSAAAWKAVRWRPWREALDGYSLGDATAILAILVPVGEALVVVAAVVGARRAASLLALGFLVAFSAAVIRRRVAGTRRVPCGCFGASESSAAAVLARNAVLAAAAVTAFGGEGAVALRSPSTADAVPIVLSALGVAGLALASSAVRRSLHRGRA